MKSIKILFSYIYTKLFSNIKTGKLTYIIKPLQIDNPKGIICGDKVHIYDYGWLYASPNKISLKIKSNVQIGHFSHIVAVENVELERDVLLADKVFISDCTHSYQNINVPILKQDIKVLKPVTIGEGSWLGENVCVCGANVGKHCVIAANSVVTKDIPDYCVAAGSPAKVVKKFNFHTQMWETVNK